MAGSQDIAEDPRNAAVLVSVNGALVPRHEARVSVFDAGFIAGDGVWEGLRLHRGRLLFLEAHLDRLFQGAAAIGLDVGLDRAGITARLHALCAANAMTDGAHLRLMVTRGEKRTPSQDPAQSIGPATMVIVAEFKLPHPDLARHGLTLATAANRVTRADQFDPRLNSHSRLPLIIALLQARQAGADEALMLDDAGFIASCNATNFFFVRDGVVCTSDDRSCFAGITRAHIVALCRAHAIPLAIGRHAPYDLAAAGEAFVTGTFGGVTPVRAIDGRALPAVPGPLTQRLRALYTALIDEEATAK
ncbi:MAG: aminotransferase class IV [Rhodospirillales bacterium]|nr:aminotransferase class IV [Rhodospirillales bacterium]